MRNDSIRATVARAQAWRAARTLAALAFAACAASLSACADDMPDDLVVTRSDPTANFTAYHTFAIQTQTPSDVAIPEGVVTNLATVTQASVDELVKLGLTQV